MIRRSLFVSFADRYSNIAIQMIAVIVLSRLLTPEQTGIYSVGAAVVALAHTLRDFGVNQYLVQEKELTRDKFATAFGVMLVTSWSVAAAMYAGRGALADWYGEPVLRDVLLLLALNFIVIPFTAPALAVLTREMAFGTLYRINVSATLINAVVSIALAAYGFGTISLAWASLAGVVGMAIVTAWLRPRETWAWPGLRHWREVGRFGGIASVTSLLTQIGLWAPEIIVGRTLGFDAVGYYSRAKGLISMFDEFIARALMPVLLADFSKSDRQGQAVGPRYLQTLAYTTAIGWPFALAIGTLAGPVILVMFGDQWTPAAPIVQILAAATAVRVLYEFSAQALVAVGRIETTLRINAIVQPVRIALVIAAAFHSLTAVAAMLVLSNLVQFALTHGLMYRIFRIRLAAIVAATSRSLAVTAMCAVPLVVLQASGWTELHPWRTMAAAAVLGPAAWLAGIWIFRHPLRDEVRLLAVRAQLYLRARRAPRPGAPTGRPAAE